MNSLVSVTDGTNDATFSVATLFTVQGGMNGTISVSEAMDAVKSGKLTSLALKDGRVTYETLTLTMTKKFAEEMRYPFTLLTSQAP